MEGVVTKQMLAKVMASLRDIPSKGKGSDGDLVVEILGVASLDL